MVMEPSTLKVSLLGFRRKEKQGEKRLTGAEFIAMMTGGAGIIPDDEPQSATSDKSVDEMSKE